MWCVKDENFFVIIGFIILTAQIGIHIVADSC